MYQTVYESENGIFRTRIYDMEEDGIIVSFFTGDDKRRIKHRQYKSVEQAHKDAKEFCML